MRKKTRGLVNVERFHPAVIKLQVSFLIELSYVSRASDQRVVSFTKRPPFGDQEGGDAERKRRVGRRPLFTARLAVAAIYVTVDRDYCSRQKWKDCV